MTDPADRTYIEPLTGIGRKVIQGKRCSDALRLSTGLWLAKNGAYGVELIGYQQLKSGRSSTV